MVFRWAAWLAIVGTLCVLSWVDGAPADPAVQPGSTQPNSTQPAGTPDSRRLFVFSVAGSTQAAGLFAGTRVVPLPAKVRLALGTPEFVQEVNDSLKSVERAEARNQHEPAIISTWLTVGGWAQSEWTVSEMAGPLGLWPAWDTQVAYHGQPGWWSCNLDHSIGWMTRDGFALKADAGHATHTVQAFWTSYRRGLAGPEPLPEAPPEPGECVARFFPTGHFHPLDDNPWLFNNLLIDRLERFSLGEQGNFHVDEIAGGVLAYGDAQYHAEVAAVLMEPGFVRLARALSCGSPARRAEARRAALADPDPQVVGFALTQLAWSADGRSELAQLDVEQLVQAGRRCEPPGLEYWVVVMEDQLQTRKPAEAVRQLEQLARTHPVGVRTSTHEPRELAILARPFDLLQGGRSPTSASDPVAILCGQALLHRAREVRQAAMAIILERLPPGALVELTCTPARWCGSGMDPDPPPPATQIRPTLERWTLAEREPFFQALVERLRTELERGDAARAVETAQDAVLLCTLDVLPDTSPVRSRVLEFGANLLADPHWTDAFAAGADPVALLGLAEALTHSSNPDVRRTGCKLVLQALLRLEGARSLPTGGFASFSLFVRPGQWEWWQHDPFLADIVDQAVRERDEKLRQRQESLGGGFRVP